MFPEPLVCVSAFWLSMNVEDWWKYEGDTVVEVVSIANSIPVNILFPGRKDLGCTRLPFPNPTLLHFITLLHSVQSDKNTQCK